VNANPISEPEARALTVTVALATGYVIWSFMSLRMRQRLLDARAARRRHRPT
jgi:hypothetical protein